MILNSSQKAYKYIKLQIRTDIEEVWVVSLNAQLTIISSELIFRGCVDHCNVHPREIIRFLCKSNASSFLFFHSHPSGNSQPSSEDLKFTKKIKKISELIEIKLLDHIIVSKSETYFSFSDSKKL